MSLSILRYWLAIDSGTICLLATWFCHWWIPCHSPRFNVPYKQPWIRHVDLICFWFVFSTSSLSPRCSPFKMAIRWASPFTSENFDCQSVRSVSIKHLFSVLSTAAPADLQVTCKISSKAGNYRKQFTLPKLPRKGRANQGSVQSVCFLMKCSLVLDSYVWFSFFLTAPTVLHRQRGGEISPFQMDCNFPPFSTWR